MLNKCITELRSRFFLPFEGKLIDSNAILV